MQANQLHVVGAYTNHNFYNVRLPLFKDWLNKTLDSGVQITVVQHTIGDTPPDITEDSVPAIKFAKLINLKGNAQQIGWLQHALYNIGLAQLPIDAQYACWQDVDIAHLNSNWPIDTLHMLQHHRVGQTWTNSIDFGPDGQILPNDWGNEVDRSFSAAFRAGDISGLNELSDIGSNLNNKAKKSDKKDYRSHTGYSWAIRIETLKKLGRLIDWMTVGADDYHIAHGFAGTLTAMCDKETNNVNYAPSYYRKLREFADLCDKYIQQDIGCIPGTITHGWHGSKKLRFYGTRGEILRVAKFDPDKDIAYDYQGIPTIVTDNRLLREGLRRYNQQRNEDSIEIY